MARFSHWDFEAVRAANRKQALVPEGSYIIDPVGTAPGVVVPGEPDRGCAPRPAARASADVAHGGEYRFGAGGHRRAHDLPPGDGPDVRAAGVRAGRHAARRRGGDRRLRRARDHHLPAPRGDRDGHALRARGGRHLHGAAGAAPRAPRARDLLRGRHAGGRPGGRSCWPGAGWPRPSRARLGCSRRGSRSARAPPLTWLVAWWPTRTRPRSTCSTWTRG